MEFKTKSLLEKIRKSFQILSYLIIACEFQNSTEKSNANKYTFYFISKSCSDSINKY